MVDDLLAYQNLFNTPGHIPDYKNRWATPLEYAEDELKPINIEDRKELGITRSQLHKFAAKFDENTTWQEFDRMEIENDKLVEEAYKKGTITDDWESDKSEERGR